MPLQHVALKPYCAYCLYLPRLCKSPSHRVVRTHPARLQRSVIRITGTRGSLERSSIQQRFSLSLRRLTASGTPKMSSFGRGSYSTRLGFPRSQALRAPSGCVDATFRPRRRGIPGTATVEAPALPAHRRPLFDHPFQVAGARAGLATPGRARAQRFLPLPWRASSRLTRRPARCRPLASAARQCWAVLPAMKCRPEIEIEHHRITADLQHRRLPLVTHGQFDRAQAAPLASSAARSFPARFMKFNRLPTPCGAYLLLDVAFGTAGDIGAGRAFSSGVAIPSIVFSSLLRNRSRTAAVTGPVVCHSARPNAVAVRWLVAGQQAMVITARSARGPYEAAEARAAVKRRNAEA